MTIAAAIATIGLGFTGAAIGMDSNMAKEGDMSDPIPARQEIMKENGAAMKAASAMAKGEAPYNETEAAGAMAIIKDNMEEFPTLFPEDSKEGGDTRALPAIWENKADFEAKAAKLAQDAAAAEQAAAQGQEAFAAALGQVGSNCGGCHETYRAPST
jgi:cytochrome c556